MDILELLKNFVDKEKILELACDEINRQLEPYGYMMVSIKDRPKSIQQPKLSVVNNTKKTTKTTKSDGTKGKRKPIRIHGVDYRSQVEAAKAYKIPAIKLGQMIKEGINPDDVLVPLKDDSEKIMQ